MAINNALNYKVTQYHVITGGANNTLNNIGLGSTSGIPAVASLGTSSQPTDPSIAVGGGGTGITSATDINSLLRSTTSTGAMTDIASVALGQVLVSKGTGITSAWSATMPITSITINGGTTLSTYTEGTWTPTIIGSSGNPTVSYTTQVGRYNRTGNSVLLTCQVVASSISGGSGNAGVGGLPFTTANVANQQYIYSTTMQNTTFAAGYLYVQGRSTENKATIGNLDLMKSASLLADIAVSSLSSTSYIWCSGWISLA